MRHFDLMHRERRAYCTPVRRAVGAALAVLLALGSPAVARAEHLEGKTNWLVTYTPDEVLKDNYSEQEWADSIAGMQPGDDITLRVNLNQTNENTVDWYMANEVLKTLEEADKGDDAEGSSYEYVLTYVGPNRSRTLYDSKIVGGDESEGLNEATDALEDYFYLDTLAKGQEGHIDLKVTMDGETEGNAYFDTLARLKMKFAVEHDPNPSVIRRRTVTDNGRVVVRTGDETRLFPFYCAMVVSGGLLLLLAVDGVRQRRAAREELEEAAE